MTMEERVKEYKIEVKKSTYIIIKNGKVLSIGGELKDEKKRSHWLEFHRWQLEHYLNNPSEITAQVNEVFKYFVKMAEIFKPEYLHEVYEVLEENDVEIFKALKKAIDEVKEEFLHQY